MCHAHVYTVCHNYTQYVTIETFHVKISHCMSHLHIVHVCHNYTPYVTFTHCLSHLHYTCMSQLHTLNLLLLISLLHLNRIKVIFKLNCQITQGKSFSEVAFDSSQNIFLVKVSISNYL